MQRLHNIPIWHKKQTYTDDQCYRYAGHIEANEVELIDFSSRYVNIRIRFYGRWIGLWSWNSEPRQRILDKKKRLHNYKVRQ